MEMAGLTAAVYAALYQEGKSARFHNFKNLGCLDEFTSSEATIQLLHLSRELFDGICRNSTSDLNILVDFLAEKYLKLETKKFVS